MSSVISMVLECLIRDFLYFLCRKMKIGNIIKPLMAMKDIMIITEILKKKKPKKCLEWGAGYGTLYFPQYLDEDAKWIAIEHDREWFGKVKQLIYCNHKISMYYVPPNHSLWTDDYGNGTFSDFKDYVRFPKRFNEKFDFILIDGRARKSCLEYAFGLLEIDGIVVLHDANRKYYHEPFELYDYQALFKDSRRDSGGIWIGSKTLGLHNILDINKHKLNWEIIESFLKRMQHWTD